MKNASNYLDNDKNVVLLDKTNTIKINEAEKFLQPHILKYVHPEYPDYAKVLGMSGQVMVIYDINDFGKVKNIRILSAVPVKGIFEKNIKLAMNRWVFVSQNSRYNLIITFKFSLNEVEVFN